MTARIEQLAVGKPVIVSHNGKDVSTAIFKSPVSTRRHVALLNIEGDGQADLSVHGGRDKAVYVYPEVHYASWAKELGVAALPRKRDAAARCIELMPHLDAGWVRRLRRVQG